MSRHIEASDFAALRRYVDRSLVQSGGAEFRVVPWELGPCLSLAMEGTRYAAWRARMISGCMVEVKRSLCSCHGYIALVTLTNIPAPLAAGGEFP